MFTLSSRRQPSASARRKALAFIIAAFFIFQQVVILAPIASAQVRRTAPRPAPPAPSAPSTTIVINEIDYDQVGTDTAEYVELKNVGASPINLDNYTVEMVNGNAGGAAVYDTINLPNVNLAAGDYYVICANAATVVNCDLDDDPNTDFIQNGSPDAVGLRLSGTLVDAVSYEGNTGAPYTETAGTPNTATGADSNTVANIGLSRFADGTDTDNNSADLTIRCITPGTANVSANTSCPAPTALPNLTINDVTANETNAGTTTFTFTVSLSAPAGPGGVTFDIATADGTAQDDNPATEDNDYVAKSLTGQTIPAGSSTYTFDVTVNGDTAAEPNETFFVNVTNVTGAAATDGQGQGTITNDDSPNLAINDVSQDEGNAGTTAFTFTVSLSTSAHGGVTFDICTADGTAQDDNPATEDNDYTANCLTSQTIPNGSDSYQFTVNVNGDTTAEPNETFFVNVTNVVGANVTDGQGQGTIGNDDFTITPIHTIQGSGAASPLAGQTVTTTGIVTLLKTSSNAGAGVANGYFLQTPDADADADPNTSQGIFVFTSSVPTVAVGDEVRVDGTVVEFNGLTEIGSVTATNIIDTGNTLPTAVTLDATILSPSAPFDQSHLEKYEAMRMSAAALLGTVPNDNFFDVETVLSSVPRQQVFREPGIPASDPVPPDPTTGTPDCCIPIWDENPERLKIDTNGRAGSPNNPYTSNVTFSNVSGPLDYAFGEYRLVTDAGFTASANMSAVPVPTPAPNEFAVVGYNIENFNNNATQRQKAALGIRTILHYPDIIGTVEIFDLADLQALRDQINNDAVAAGDPNPMYEAYLVEQDGTSEDNDQDVGYLVKTARVSVTSVTQEREEETFVEPGGGTAILHDRPPLVLDAIVDPSGANPQRVLVVVNHLRSFIDIELVAGDGPRVREKRKKQAESLADLLNDLQIANPTTPVISVGDYNAFQFSSGYDDSISVLKGNPTPDDQIVVDQSPDLVNPDFYNVLDEVPAAERYSFNFEGTMQALDHVLVNQAARARSTRVAVAHMNVDFPEVPAATYASNTARPERNSDHDPAVAYFALGEPQPTGSVIISEFRFRGPDTVEEAASDGGDSISALGAPIGSNAPGTSSDNDEFVEIYNNTDADITVQALDGSAGWALVASDGVVRFTIPNGTVIPARGHFLGTNTDGYSLANYGCEDCALGDAEYTLDIPDGGGIALFRTSNAANFTADERLDAAGYAGVDALYREGAGFPTGGAETTSDLEYSFVRYMGINASGRPRDTGNNLADFIAVNTSGASTALGAKLGAPGPENLFSPIQSNATVPASSLDGTVSATSPPNRIRDLNDTGQNKSFGTLSIRRTLTNNTGRELPYLIMRIVDLTTFAPPDSATADLRALDSATVTVTVNDNARCASDPTATSTTAPCDVTVQGLFVEQPPDQPNGGGWNTSLLLLFEVGDELAAGATVNVNFTFGVEQRGAYRFFYNIEAPPDSGIVAPVGTQMPGRMGRPTRRAPR